MRKSIVIIAAVLILAIVLSVSCSQNRLDDPGDWSFYTRIDNYFLFVTLNFHGAGNMVMKVSLDSADSSGSFEVTKKGTYSPSSDSTGKLSVDFSDEERLSGYFTVFSGTYSCSGYTLEVTTDNTAIPELRNMTFRIYGTIPD